jgi:hypothetical protein
MSPRRYASARAARLGPSHRSRQGTIPLSSPPASPSIRTAAPFLAPFLATARAPAATTLATVNTATARTTSPFSSNYFLPIVHCHSPELQGHLQGIGDRQTRRLCRGTPPPPVNPPPSRRPAPSMISLRHFLARWTPLASLVRVVKTFLPLGHRRTPSERAITWPVSTVTTWEGGRHACRFGLPKPEPARGWTAPVGRYGLSA